MGGYGLADLRIDTIHFTYMYADYVVCGAAFAVHALMLSVAPHWLTHSLIHKRTGGKNRGQ